MIKKLCLLLVTILLFGVPSFAYKIEGGEYYVGGGFGANVNVVRNQQVAANAKPKADLPLFMTIDYAIDRNIGLTGSFIPQFGAGSLAFSFRGGIKYWFSFLSAPYVPYVSLALTPSFLLPLGSAPNHFNLGLSPGVGMNFFVMANFLVGAHVHFNPSMAFVDGDKQWEFAVTSLFDVAFRI